MMIDIHPHVISTDTARYPLAPVGGHQSDWSRKRPVSYQQMIAAMDAAGIAKSAVVQASTAYGNDNSYLADAVAAHPDRFTGVFSADILAPDAIATMKRWMAKGLTGMRLFTSGSTMPDQATWFADPATYPAWEFAGEAGLSVCMQMRMKGLPPLKGLVERFPKVRFIIDHMARVELADGPPYAGAADLLAFAKYPNVYLKVTHRAIDESASGKSTTEAFFTLVIKQFGAARLAWGSNYPAAEENLTELADKARQAFAFLSQADRDWIFAKTAQTLYPVLAK
jgi:L-fuconolactonase